MTTSTTIAESSILEQLHKIVEQRIMVIDGAMGTMIQEYGLDEADYKGSKFEHLPQDLKGNNDLLSITRPDVIENIHKAYLEAGADIIETNTFNANAISQEDYQLSEFAYEINVAAAQCAKRATNTYNQLNPSKPRFVAGAFGPTSKTASMSPDVNDPGYRAVSFDELVEAYYDQAKGLADGGCDLFLVETIFDTLNCKAALFAIDKYCEDVGIAYCYGFWNYHRRFWSDIVGSNCRSILDISKSCKFI